MILIKLTFSVASNKHGGIFLLNKERMFSYNTNKCPYFGGGQCEDDCWSNHRDRIYGPVRKDYTAEDRGQRYQRRQHPGNMPCHRRAACIFGGQHTCLAACRYEPCCRITRANCCELCMLTAIISVLCLQCGSCSAGPVVGQSRSGRRCRNWLTNDTSSGSPAQRPKLL
ncbi:hypothetical protein SAMN04487895_12513 [Paenibacillus sophorae]|uniref:Uncharacterized protein n=1 Tax=Paenibacillus sophorae TaxID=1333845 RepID=A0A1H8VJQ1_9BACL|nr:hypothetical protein SAMN04487895_12513 [Paenibacillus sophorae]